jgi:hypothetical protein
MDKGFIDDTLTKETLDDRRSIEESSNPVKFSGLIAKNATCGIND